jgi:hypothetical protein
MSQHHRMKEDSLSRGGPPGRHRRGSLRSGTVLPLLSLLAVVATACGQSTSSPTTPPSSTGGSALASPTSGPTATPAVAHGQFSPAGSIDFAPDTATRLQDGTVLLAGGGGCSGDERCALYSNQAALYSSAAGFGPTIRMAHKRTNLTATLLQDGSVLLAGGLGDASASAELYVPGTGFVATGSMATERSGAAAAPLFDGVKVLIVGGTNSSELASAEVYDSSTGKFTPTGSMKTARWGATATWLPSQNKVLVAGGYDGDKDLASAELYDPATGKFAATGSMAVARDGHTATLLQSGRVLIVGLSLSDISPTTALAEFYDPATGKFTSAGSLPSPVYDLSATLLQDGRVLVVGGDTDLDSDGASDKAYLWSEDTKTFTPTGSLATARGWPVATLLSDGRVLVATGSNDSGVVLAAELYQP